MSAAVIIIAGRLRARETSPVPMESGSGAMDVPGTGVIDLEARRPVGERALVLDFISHAEGEAGVSLDPGDRDLLARALRLNPDGTAAVTEDLVELLRSTLGTAEAERSPLDLIVMALLAVGRRSFP